MGKRRQEYQESLRLKPESYVYNNLAECYSAQGRISAAITTFKLSLQLDPQSSEALNSLAWLYATASDPKLRDAAESLRLAQLAVKYSSTPNPAFLDTLAEALLLNGQSEEALRTEQQAAQLSPKDANFQTRLKRFEHAAQTAP